MLTFHKFAENFIKADKILSAKERYLNFLSKWKNNTILTYNRLRILNSIFRKSDCSSYSETTNWFLCVDRTDILFVAKKKLSSN